jgi:hypothetical protein
MVCLTRIAVSSVDGHHIDVVPHNVHVLAWYCVISVASRLVVSIFALIDARLHSRPRRLGDLLDGHVPVPFSHFSGEFLAGNTAC